MTLAPEFQRQALESLRVAVTLAVWVALRTVLDVDAMNGQNTNLFLAYLGEALILLLALVLVAIPTVLWTGRPTLELIWFDGQYRHESEELLMHATASNPFRFLTIRLDYHESRWLAWIRTSILHLQQRELEVRLHPEGIVDLVIESDPTGRTSINSQPLCLSFSLGPTLVRAVVAQPQIEFVSPVEPRMTPVTLAVSLNPAVPLWQRPLVRIISKVRVLQVQVE